jgi:hypothetical protein
MTGWAGAVTSERCNDAVHGFATWVVMALTRFVLMTFLGFASAVKQAQTFSSAKIRMFVLVLVLCVCRIGEVSHSGPDAELFSFVLGTANPTGLRCKAMYVTELMSYGGFPLRFVCQVSCCARVCPAA